VLPLPLAVLREEGDERNAVRVLGEEADGVLILRSSRMAVGS
jgi:hypothetical protein